MSASAPIDFDTVPRGKRIGRAMAGAEADAKAARLRSDGWSYRQIGSQLGCSHTAAMRMVERALQAVPVKSVHELRRVENAAIDADMAALQAIVDDPPFVVVPGAGVTTQRDMRVVVAALDARTRLRARWAKMNGVDAPTVSVHKTQTETELDNEIKRLMAELIMHGQLIAGEVER